jgi:hypothetical protein
MFGFTPVELAVVIAIAAVIFCWRIRVVIRDWRKIRATPHDQP